MGIETIDILVTDDQFAYVGDPIQVADSAAQRAGWVEIEAVRRFNRPGAGVAKMAAYPSVLAQLVPGNRLVLRRDGVIWSSGPIEAEPGELVWEADPGGPGAGPGVVTARWSDDMATIAERVVFPTPGSAWSAQNTSAQWTANAAAGTVLHSLVNLNAGPGALVARRVTGLTMGAGSGLGSTVKVRARFEALGDVARAVAVSGGGLGFKVTQVGSGIVFDVYQPADKLGVRFSREAGNLRSLTYRPESPTGNVALVAGSGAGTARTMREVINSASVTRWKRRIEHYVDKRQSSDTTELDQAGAEANAERGERSGLAAVTVDAPGTTYGTDFDLGDKVYVVVADGIEVPDIVQAVTLTARAGEGELVAAQVGTGELRGDPPWLRLWRDVNARLRIVEAD